MLSNRSLVYTVALGLGCAMAGCTVEQNFGGAGSSDTPGGTIVPGNSNPDPGDGGISAAGATRSWQWLNPARGGATLRAVWASSSHDVWYVGEQGTVIHWDGVRATKPYEGSADQTFYTVWASGPNDVWIAGDHGANTPNVVLHWDGLTWSSDFSLAVQRVHSLWGIDANHVFAMTNPWSSGGSTTHGEVWWWNGHKWSLWGSPAPGLPAGCGTCPQTGCYGTCVSDAASEQGAADGQNPPLLRDAWGIDSDQIWVVGDGGTLARLSVNEPGRLTRWPAAPGSPIDPFDPKLDYVGVWGSAADDVWAIYAEHQRPSNLSSEGHLGLAHWDGQGWRAESNTYSLGSVYDSTAVVPAGPLREGHLLFGLGASTVVQIAGHLFYQAANLYNGTPFSFQPSDKLGPRNWGLAGDGEGHLYAAAEFGAALEWQPSAPGQLWTGTWDKSAQMDFTSIAPIAENEAFATGGPTGLAHWTGTVWSPVQVDPVTTNGATQTIVFGAVSASSARDVWAVGIGAAAHFDGTTWSSMPVTSQQGLSPNLMSVWVANPNDAWAVGSFGASQSASWAFIFHWDGVRWNEVLTESTVGLRSNSAVFIPMSVFGVSASDVWIIGSAGPLGVGQLVWHWDGRALERVSSFPSDAFASQVWGTSASDLWSAPAPNLSTTPSPLFHFDGTSWTELATNTDSPVLAVSGTGASDVWMIARGPYASASSPGPQGSLIRSWDGQVFRTALDSPLVLTALGRGPDGQLWAAGAAGATLRLPASSKPSTR